MKKKIFFGFFLPLFLAASRTSATLQVSLPSADNCPNCTDLQQAIGWETEVTSDPNNVITLIQTINTYLWFSIGVIAMVVFVIGGIKLISARGDSKELKKAIQTIIGALIGITIAIFSYLIVRLVLNLF